jgi:hypothetical protein
VLVITKGQPGANPTILSYNAGAVKVRLEKKYFLPFFEKTL